MDAAENSQAERCLSDGIRQCLSSIFTKIDVAVVADGGTSEHVRSVIEEGVRLIAREAFRIGQKSASSRAGTREADPRNGPVHLDHLNQQAAVRDRLAHMDAEAARREFVAEVVLAAAQSGPVAIIEKAAEAAANSWDKIIMGPSNEGSTLDQHGRAIPRRNFDDGHGC